ncbi:MAG: hypothetical protein IMZ54_10530 [Acidobacteria bacterium]|nr:hypothetical protein [Acidobacteriota bacterium]
MEEKIRAFREHILDSLDELERELHRTKADWEEKKGVFHDEGYVYRENLAVFEEELSAVRRTRDIITAMDASGFSEISEFRADVIATLERTAKASVLLRSGIAIIVRLIKLMDDGTVKPPFCP